MIRLCTSSTFSSIVTSSDAQTVYNPSCALLLMLQSRLMPIKIVKDKNRVIRVVSHNRVYSKVPMESIPSSKGLDQITAFVIGICVCALLRA